MNLQIVIPMAGRGSRFKDYLEPKPLINIAGKTMIEHSLSSLKLNGKFIFITRKYDNPEWNVKLNAILPSSNIISIDYITEGAAATVLLAKEHLDLEKPLLVADCDAIYNIDWDNYLRFCDRPIIDQCSITYFSDKNTNSYANVTSSGRIIETAEKKVISNNSFTGAHFWKKAKYFVDSAEAMIKANDRTNNEFYISPSINYLVRDGLNCYIYPISTNQYWQVGTPEDLCKYLDLMK